MTAWYAFWHPRRAAKMNETQMESIRYLHLAVATHRQAVNFWRERTIKADHQAAVIRWSEDVNRRVGR